VHIQVEQELIEGGPSPSRVTTPATSVTPQRVSF